MADQLSRAELLRLARLGAASRLNEIREEIAGLERLLRGTSARKDRGTRRKAARDPATGRTKQSAAWSPAKRRAVSLRMKKYWAARRQAKKR